MCICAHAHEYTAAHAHPFVSRRGLSNTNQRLSCTRVCSNAAPREHVHLELDVRGQPPRLNDTALGCDVLSHSEQHHRAVRQGIPACNQPPLLVSPPRMSQVTLCVLGHLSGKLTTLCTNCGLLHLLRIHPDTESLRACTAPPTTHTTRHGIIESLYTASASGILGVATLDEALAERARRRGYDTAAVISQGPCQHL